MRSSRQPATVPYPENQDTCITLASTSQTWKTHPSFMFGPIIIYPPAFLWQCTAQSHLSTRTHLQLCASKKNAHMYPSISSEPFYIEKHIHTPNTCSIKKFTENILNTEHVNKHIISYFKRRLHEDILITGNRTRGDCVPEFKLLTKAILHKIHVPNNPS